MLLKLIILSVVLVGIALAGLAISMLIRPHGKFPDTHISHNKEMRKRGITCAQHNDVGCHPTQTATGCAGCSCVED